MSQENEPKSVPQESPDLFTEPRDHANQWDISALWLEETVKRVEASKGREVE